MSISHEDLLQRIRAFEPSIAHIPCRALPATFTPDDASFTVFPASIEWKWDSLAAFLRDTGSRGVLSRTPLFWQLESALHDACARESAIFYLNDAANMPLGAAALRNMDIGTVITDAKDARTFSEFLKTAGVGARTWLVIHSLLDMKDDVPESDALTAHEYHLFPGVPILVQCAAIAAKKAQHFHIADAFALDQEEGASVISSVSDLPLPIEKYRLPIRLSGRGPCACGKELFERAHD